jgi:hypothetical protein
MLGRAGEPASGGKPTQHPAVPTSSREKGCRESVEVRSERSAWLVSVTGVATSPTFLFKFSETRAFKIPEYIKEGRRFAQLLQIRPWISSVRDWQNIPDSLAVQNED